MRFLAKCFIVDANKTCTEKWVTSKSFANAGAQTTSR
ncbi:hypothetical protein MGSAQ_000484 [marine sediment metagenome]|uniref:Uncharacterized protein n=1 Tax=marine sediment metagenome TaxID=412755 RepID=A0A1B6NX37_9ZZZZ